MAGRRFVRSPLGAGLAAAAIAMAVLALLLLAGGFDVERALAAMWNGAAGSPYAFFSGTLVRATPLILAGLAVAVAFQAGLLNIGAEGQLLAGASAAAVVAMAMPRLSAWVLVPGELAAAIAAGAAWAGIAALLKQRFRVLEVISTLMLNFIAQFGVSYLVHGPLEEPTHVFPQSATLPPSARLPLVIPGQRLHLGFVIAVGLAVGVWWILRATAAGFRIRVVGAGTAAATSAGRVRVSRVIVASFLASGAIAGLAGAVQLTGVTYALYEGFSPGYGYLAIAVALLARLHPLGVVAAGIFFGGLEAGGAALQRDANLPAGVVAVVEALVILGVLAVDRSRRWVGQPGAPPAGTRDE